MQPSVYSVTQTETDKTETDKESLSKKEAGKKEAHRKKNKAVNRNGNQVDGTGLAVAVAQIYQTINRLMSAKAFHSTVLH